jgi:hypothetical protein
VQAKTLTIVSGVATAAIVVSLIALAQPSPIAPTKTSATTLSTPAALASTDAQATMIAWSADDGDPRAFTVGDLTLTMSSRPHGPDDPPTPVLHVEHGGKPFETEGAAGFEKAAARFGVGRLEAGPGPPQVIFTSFSGGAHCCTSVTILDQTSKGWVAVDAGSWDGGVLESFPTDIDGDGNRELVVGDDRFAYAFDSYASSPKPPRLFNYHAGKLAEVSGSPAFKAYYESQLPDLQTACEAHANGACAAYVAIAARVGQARQAWSKMIQNHAQDSDWVLPSGCAVALVEGSCPKDQEIAFRSYPAALAGFLRDAGYFKAGQGLEITSFDCAKAEVETLLLVCTDPDLAAADQALAVVYKGALARCADPEVCFGLQK